MNVTTKIPTLLPLSRAALVQAMIGGLIPKWCLFWGHTPAKDRSVTKSCFSQWWDGHPFVIEEVTYPTAEHYMMAEKARLFDDGEILSQILSSRHPSEAKKLGRKVRGLDEVVWLEARWDIVVRANLAKFSRHPDLREFLLNTGDRILVEASPFDRIWGIGMGASNPDAGEPARWKGLNLLGFALMAVREKLSSSGL